MPDPCIDQNISLNNLCLVDVYIISNDPHCHIFVIVCVSGKLSILDPRAVQYMAYYQVIAENFVEIRRRFLKTLSRSRQYWSL